MTQYTTVQNTLVKDHIKKQSYNLNNKHDAQQLAKTLNTTYNTLQHYKNIEKQHDKITKTIIQLKLTINILSDEINNLQEMMTNENNND
jgi:hypothetical protein